MAASVIIYSFSKFWPSSETNTSLDVKYCSILRSLEAFLGMELLFLLGFCFSLRPIFCGVSFVKVLGPGLSTVYIRCHIIKLFFNHYYMDFSLSYRLCVVSIFLLQKKFKFIPKAINFYVKLILYFVFVHAEPFTS